MDRTVVVAEDKSAHLAVKDAILARSGIYLYSYADVKAMGLTPKENKQIYREYRPAGVIIQSKDKFSLVPVTRDHPPVGVTPDNYHQYASGVTGNLIEAVPLPDGEVGLKGQIAFFTRDAYDFYMAGSKETSAGYSKKVVYSDDPETDGYDWVMTGITSVNHTAVLPEGRGGRDVRVLDKAAMEPKNYGGFSMDKVKSGFLSSLFGIGAAKDANFKLSTVLMGSVAKMHSLDQAGVEKEVSGVLGHIKALGESEAREVLIGAVVDCFKNPVEVLAQKDAISQKIDELFVKCQASDAEAVKRILDSEPAEKKKEDEQKEDKKKEGDGKEAKDAALTVDAVDAAVQKAFTSVLNGLDEKINDGIKAAVDKALGLDGDKSKDNVKDAQDGRTVETDSVDSGDTSYLFNGIFGF